MTRILAQIVTILFWRPLFRPKISVECRLMFILLFTFCSLRRYSLGFISQPVHNFFTLLLKTVISVAPLRVLSAIAVGCSQTSIHWIFSTGTTDERLWLLYLLSKLLRLCKLSRGYYLFFFFKGQTVGSIRVVKGSYSIQCIGAGKISYKILPQES